MTKVLESSASYMAGQVDSSPDLNNLASTDKLLATYLDSVRDGLMDIFNLCKNIDIKTPQKKDAKSLLSQFQSVDSAATLMNSYLSMSAMAATSQSNVIGKASSWVSGTLVPWLKNMWGSVWALISKLVTPKEWKIKGSVGTSLLGLANAELEITFG